MLSVLCCANCCLCRELLFVSCRIWCARCCVRCAVLRVGGWGAGRETNGLWNNIVALLFLLGHDVQSKQPVWHIKGNTTMTCPSHSRDSRAHACQRICRPARACALTNEDHGRGAGRETNGLWNNILALLFLLGHDVQPKQPAWHIKGNTTKTSLSHSRDSRAHACQRIRRPARACALTNVRSRHGKHPASLRRGFTISHALSSRNGGHTHAAPKHVAITLTNYLFSMLPRIPGARTEVELVMLA